MIKTPFEPTDFVLGDILRRMAEISPDATYLRFKDQSLTFGQLDEQSDRLAVGLSKLGICRNDRIAVMLPNHPAYVVCVYAIAKLGAVLVPLNPSLRGNLIQQALKTAEPRLLIVHKPVTEYLHGQYENLKGLRALVVYDEEDSLETHAHGQQELILLNQLFERNGNVPDIQCKPGDLQAIMFTSGTTGTSKAVMVPHALGLTCAAKFLETVDYRHDETIYCPLPLFHATGSWEGLMSSLLTGGESAIVGRFSASAFWDDIRHFNANIALGVFSMVPILLNRSPTSDDKAHQLRVFYTGKSNHDRTFSERFKTHCVENYASTEVGIAIAATYGELKEGSCGKVCEDTHEVRIADSEDRELPAGEIG
jgi:crotonobetaine/carnitine-CoA ligase